MTDKPHRHPGLERRLEECHLTGVRVTYEDDRVILWPRNEGDGFALANRLEDKLILLVEGFLP